jgi:hypothetical protein
MVKAVALPIGTVEHTTHVASHRSCTEVLTGEGARSSASCLIRVTVQLYFTVRYKRTRRTFCRHEESIRFKRVRIREILQRPITRHIAQRLKTREATVEQ